MSSFIPKMYMTVSGVQGEVIVPPAFMGAFELEFLIWPDASFYAVGRAVDEPDRPRRALQADDFPEVGGKKRPGPIKLGLVEGRHRDRLRPLYAGQDRDRQSLSLELWIALEHNKFLRAELRSASIRKAYEGILVGNAVMQSRTSSHPGVFEILCKGRMRADGRA